MQLEEQEYQRANDRATLKLRYVIRHLTSYTNFKEVFSIIFVDTTHNQTELDFLKRQWINYLQGTINKKKVIILPLYDNTLLLFNT